MMNRKKKKGKLATFLLLVLFFMIGFGIYMYPYIADAWNAYRNSMLIADYKEVVQDKEKADEYNSVLAKADAYNKTLSSVTGHLVTSAENVKDLEYESLLNYSDSGAMGYIEIPKIQIQVPVYHYSTDEVLDRGIGHIHGSSLPIGGEGTHSLLTGHRGLPESKLFTDLDQIKVGDKFYLHMLTRDLAYEVTDINVVLPHDVDMLTIEPGEDKVTLVTCTPYGVNTHRLLVTGKRTEYKEEVVEEENKEGRALTAQSKITPMNAMVLGFIVLMLMIIISVIVSRVGGRKGQTSEENK